MTDKKSNITRITPEMVKSFIDKSNIASTQKYLILMQEILNLQKVVDVLIYVIERITPLEVAKEVKKNVDKTIYQKNFVELENANDIIKKEYEKEKKLAEDFKKIFGFYPDEMEAELRKSKEQGEE